MGLKTSINSCATTHRHRERERRALPNLALDPDLAAVQLDEFPRQCQPQSRALDLPVRSPDLPELLEHRLLILRRDADPGVGDRDLNHAVPRYCVDVNPATFRRELDRVREQ